MQRIELPIWLLPTKDSIEHGELTGTVGLRERAMLAMVRLGDGGDAVMAFTTLAKAEAYAASYGGDETDFYPLQLSDPVAFIATLDAMRQRGVVAMVLDDDDGEAFKLDAILAAARGALGEELGR